MRRILIVTIILCGGLFVSISTARKTYSLQEVEAMMKGGKFTGTERFVIIRGKESTAIIGDKTEFSMPESDTEIVTEAKPLTPELEEAVEEEIPVPEPEEAVVEEENPVPEPEESIEEETPVSELEEAAVEEEIPVSELEEAMEEEIPISEPEEAAEEESPIPEPEEAEEETPIPEAEEVVEEEIPISEPANPAVVPEAIVQDKVTRRRFLITMAREHYGNGDLWVYIYEENKDKLGHPDRITPGTDVIIPDLKKYGVDPGNASDVEKAKKLGREIYGRYSKRI